ncbi:UPF0587 protein F46B6.12 [Caenorhabditis elegans]|uniref:UPF0587 protein F46B6.12 n=1 Tax=Caenorhabditis elegans TaxID=6239 RepID=U587_CAEEL|nr:UPF0587 protein F46B6.12 [Caenorhabditis elegans]Q9BI88.2 RecName: Full=UPF0587 protein F46B6.12 [Caenorhabditis elegans]CAC35815.2 UPF0587 protein F46B6.12 [Caenorhabditis elegans]|eukprot:NP_505521.2 UPF0587 protein F46B6.12 [Caenorhabditis elegans]
MPFLALELKCQLKGITDLRPDDTDSFHWHMKLKCTNCGEAPDHWQYVVLNEMLDVPGSRGEANLVEKCKLCGRVNTLTIVEDMFKSYNIEQNEKWQQIAVFDCRGLEPFDFDPRDEWIAKSVETGNAFHEIDLSEKEWVDFDDKAMEAVEISEMSSQFTTIRDPKKK